MFSHAAAPDKGGRGSQPWGGDTVLSHIGNLDGTRGPSRVRIPCYSAVSLRTEPRLGGAIVPSLLTFGWKLELTIHPNAARRRLCRPGLCEDGDTLSMSPGVSGAVVAPGGRAFRRGRCGAHRRTSGRGGGTG